MKKNNPPEWAVEKALTLFEAEGPGKPHSAHSATAFARYIAEHEEEPVDPLLLEAREICAAVATEWKPSAAKEYRDGDYDSDDEVLFVLATLKRVKEQS